jgi:glucose/arabinose dehydrogenase
MRRLEVIGVVVAALVALALPATASAVRLVPVASGLGELTQVTAPRSGKPGVLYLVQRDGQIFRQLNGRRLRFLDIRRIVSCCNGEQGLGSMAFDPAYRTNRLFYVYYTNVSGDIRVARIKANSTSTRAVRSTLRVILRVAHPPATNHNGGQVAVGPNGRLYAATGDGGGGCDPGGHSQNLRSRLGKLLSVNPRNLAAGWRLDGYGLRNPWRFSFDRSTGRLYIGDVGQDDWEEIDTRSSSNLGLPRENYGWDVREGRQPSGCTHGPLNQAGVLVGPVSVYPHTLGCSITGGFAYRGRALDALRGSYVFGDYCTGRIWRIRVGSNGGLVVGRRQLRDTSLNITSFGEGVLGELYVVHQGGTVYKLVRS